MKFYDYQPLVASIPEIITLIFFSLILCLSLLPVLQTWARTPESKNIEGIFFLTQSTWWQKWKTLELASHSGMCSSQTNESTGNVGTTFKILRIKEFSFIFPSLKPRISSLTSFIGWILFSSHLARLGLSFLHWGCLSSRDKNSCSSNTQD